MGFSLCAAQMPAIRRKRMSLLSLEHSATAYRLDFALYALLCLGTAAVAGARSHPWGGSGTGAGGGGGVERGPATLPALEGGVERVRLEGDPPFRRGAPRCILRSG